MSIYDNNGYQSDEIMQDYPKTFCDDLFIHASGLHSLVQELYGKRISDKYSRFGGSTSKKLPVNDIYSSSRLLLTFMV